MTMFKVERERRQVLTPVEGKTMTQQSCKDECDINLIMSKYQKTGLLDHVKEYQGQYGDFTGVFDYKEALDFVQEAQEMFMTLPSSVRAQFDHDPGAFLDFVDDPANLKEMEAMGLVEPKDGGLSVDKDVSPPLGRVEATELEPSKE